MQGRRREVPSGHRIAPDDPKPGDYWRDADGLWWAFVPDGGGIGVLSEHTVIEHGDGTITATPSILMPGKYHGYLTRGVWGEC